MIVLGSTGSIGVSTLDIARQFGIKIEALSCNKNYKLLNEQIAEFSPKFVCIADESLKPFVKHKFVYSGNDGILKMLENSQSKTVVNALVGFAGLVPSIKTQALNKTLCLANKESLVVGGKFLKTSEIRPIDSEHFGLKFLLKDSIPIHKLIITASGGAFRDTPLSELSKVTPKQALKHPNWQMGAKITIDSASMANKLFEIIEAYWLYGCKNIDALIERSSAIHALIEFVDGSTTAHISATDMHLAIAHAVVKDLKTNITPHANLTTLNSIKFEPICIDKYPVFALKDELIANPNIGVIINAANEVFVEKFLNNECKFTDIKAIIYKSLDKFIGLDKFSPSSVEEICEIDRQVRIYAKGL